MARYQPRHAPRHAAPRRSLLSRAGSAMGARVLASGVAIAAVTGATAAYASLGDAVATDAVALTLSATQASTTVAEERERVQEGADRALARSSHAMAVSARTAKTVAAERARQVALAKARTVAAAHAAQVAQRRQVMQNAQKDPKAAARMLLPEFGFGMDQWECLDRLWIGESNWRWSAENPSSGAYGIPQSLPGSKMASVAPDWRTNPVTQIRWGLQYIKSSYGSPCGALNAWNSRYPHWY